jgi:putative phosphoesterase
VLSKPIIIGLISDTHNLLRPEAKRALAGVSRILHAGDICGPEVLAGLSEIAPVTAVRGNNDHGPWADAIPVTEAIEIDGVAIYMLHNLSELDLDPQAAGFHVVMSGHTHRPLVEHKGSVLFVNPGSAGPRRFKLPISLAMLEIGNGGIEARLLTLEG